MKKDTKKIIADYTRYRVIGAKPHPSDEALGKNRTAIDGESTVSFSVRVEPENIRAKIYMNGQPMGSSANNKKDYPGEYVFWAEPSDPKWHAPEPQKIKSK